MKLDEVRQHFIPGSSKKERELAKHIVDSAQQKVSTNNATYELEIVANKLSSPYSKEVQDAVKQEVKTRKMKHARNRKIDTKV